MADCAPDSSSLHQVTDDYTPKFDINEIFQPSTSSSDPLPSTSAFYQPTAYKSNSDCDQIIQLSSTFDPNNNVLDIPDSFPDPSLFSDLGLDLFPAIYPDLLANLDEHLFSSDPVINGESSESLGQALMTSNSK